MYADATLFLTIEINAVAAVAETIAVITHSAMKSGTMDSTHHHQHSQNNETRVKT